MEAQVIESQRLVSRKPQFSPIRWSAVFAGIAVGVASYLLMALLGIAVGLTAVDPQAAEPAAGIPIATGIWTGASMLISAFVGGYVAGRLSGLSRLGDGLLHGFVAWASVTLVFAYMMTSAASSVLGGTFSVLGRGLQGAGQVAAVTTDPQRNQSPSAANEGLLSQLQSVITGAGGADISGENMNALQARLQAGDREGAVDVMVNQMGFTQARADQTVDKAMLVFGPGGEQRVRNAADTAVSALTAASWWLFVVLALSLAISVWAGVKGVRATSQRTPGHPSERSVGAYPVA